MKVGTVLVVCVLVAQEDQMEDDGLNDLRVVIGQRRSHRKLGRLTMSCRRPARAIKCPHFSVSVQSLMGSRKHEYSTRSLH